MQLKTLASRLPLGDGFHWVTVPTPQSESLLAGEDVTWVHPGPTRDLRAAARNALLAAPLFRRRRISAVVSTGSSLAVSVIPQARLRGLPAYYIESATRTHGPSLSGRMLAAVPGVELYTQNAAWQSKKWKYAGSVFDGWQSRAEESGPPVKKVVVTLGTSRTYGFRRLVERLAPLLADTGAEVLWQTGVTDVSGLPIQQARKAVPAAELSAAMREADVVIAHAGTGAALEALQAGKLPILVPRRVEHDEHVDDHQDQIATMLRSRGLAIVREADTIDLRDLDRAASNVVELRGDALPLAL
ncbi:glycosyltransferase [Kineococcus gynurae]|uniref:Glycosyltransferase n=1 Tax=Kineococcus gynurae TaxID=452979 RepID=A0ABV5LWN5_9ACTN